MTRPCEWSQSWGGSFREIAKFTFRAETSSRKEPEQPIFYPVLNEDYAIKIARDWNVQHDGAGYVTRFEVETDFLARYPVRQAGGETILELWVPAEELDEFNAHIVGTIELVHEFV